MLIGQLIAKAAMKQDYEVSWMPSYGPEMRGGEANCAVVVSDEPIGSPLVSEPPVLIAMNKPSLVKFMPMMPAGGVLLYNSSLIEDPELREDITVIPVPCNEIAEKLQNTRTANMVMLGAYIEAMGNLGVETIKEMLVHMFTGPKAKLVDLNIEALRRGAACVK